MSTSNLHTYMTYERTTNYGSKQKRNGRLIIKQHQCTRYNHMKTYTHITNLDTYIMTKRNGNKKKNKC